MSGTISSPAGAAETETIPLSPESTLLSHSDAGPRYLFYRYVCGDPEDIPSVSQAPLERLEQSYRCVVWRPRGWRILPRGLSGARLRVRFLFRWALDRLHIFAGPGFGAILIYDGHRIVHYSAFTPRYWRFPFIANGDFQIGDTWTDAAYRGLGLASFGLLKAVALLAKPRRQLWYVVESINEPSIRVAEKAHFVLAAQGTFVQPWGLKLARAYVIRQTCDDSLRG